MATEQKIKWLSGMETAKYLNINQRQVYKDFDAGKLEDNGLKGHRRRFKIIEVVDSQESKSRTVTSYDLKDQHLQIRIKKEEQLLYENKLLLAEKIADCFLEIYHLPRISKLTELVRKYGNEELIAAWNKQIDLGATESLKELQDELQRLTLD